MSKLVVDDGAKDPSLRRVKGVAKPLATKPSTQVFGREDGGDEVVEATPDDVPPCLALGPECLEDLSRYGVLVVVDIDDDEGAAGALRVEKRDGGTVGEVRPRDRAGVHELGAVRILEAAVEAHRPTSYRDDSHHRG